MTTCDYDSLKRRVGPYEDIVMSEREKLQHKPVSRRATSRRRLDHFGQGGKANALTASLEQNNASQPVIFLLSRSALYSPKD